MLRTRLLTFLGLLVAVVLAIGASALWLFSEQARRTDRAVLDSYPSVVAVREMYSALSILHASVLQAAEGKTDFALELFAKERRRFETNLTLQFEVAALPGEYELTERLATNYQAFAVAGSRVFAMTNAGEQRAFNNAVIFPGVYTNTLLLDAIRQMNHDAIFATRDDVQRLGRQVMPWILVGMALSLVLAVAAYLHFRRTILGPLQSVTDATRAIGKGEYDRSVPVVTGDELGELAVAFNRTVAQLREYRANTDERILKLHRTMYTTLATFPDPIFVLNSAGEIELRNPSAEELAAQLHWDHALPERLQRIADHVLRTGENYLPYGFEEAISFRLEDQDKFFLPRILAMPHKDKASLGVAVVLYDVTRFRLMDDVKTNLLATVSHELKTPLTSVRVVLHLLLERTLGPLTAKQTDLLTTARDDAERLLRILNDLLDLAKLEEGNGELTLDKVDPGELAQKIVQEVRDSVALRGQSLTSAIEPDLPPVRVDQQRITHVFTNFVTNAIKYSPPGGEILVKTTLTDSGQVCFSVIDHGPGIAEEFQTRIFDRFFRVPGRTVAGAGLGLSIARQIVLAHGGHIGVRSQPGQGSEFYFVLDPVHEGRPPSLEVPPARHAPFGDPLSGS